LLLVAPLPLPLPPRFLPFLPFLAALQPRSGGGDCL
jgi:hypothetical protein